MGTLDDSDTKIPRALRKDFTNTHLFIAPIPPPLTLILSLAFSLCVSLPSSLSVFVSISVVVSLSVSVSVPRRCHWDSVAKAELSLGLCAQLLLGVGSTLRQWGSGQPSMGAGDTGGNMGIDAGSGSYQGSASGDGGGGGPHFLGGIEACGPVRPLYLLNELAFHEWAIPSFGHD